MAIRSASMSEGAELTIIAKSWTHSIKMRHVASGQFTFGNSIHSHELSIRDFSGNSLLVSFDTDEIAQFKALIRVFEDNKINHEIRYRK